MGEAMIRRVLSLRRTGFLGRRVLLVLCVLAALTALVVVSGASGSTAGAKYKLVLNSLSLSCVDLPSCDFDSVVIRRVDDDRTSCHPLLDFSECKWTAPAGTKVVLEISSSMPDGTFLWTGDCSNTGPRCKIVMDSNKAIGLEATWTGP
jgi:hypothetical protein